jgi:hypothetical protein
MEFRVLDEDFVQIHVLDVFDSAIWTDRFFEAGDFKIKLSMTAENYKHVLVGRYVWNSMSDRIMMIEKIVIESSSDEGSMMTVSGRSLEYLMFRRIIWGQRRHKTNLHDTIKTMIMENMVAPSDGARKMSWLTFEDNPDPRLAKIQVDVQHTGDNLYTAVTELLEKHHVGIAFLYDGPGQIRIRLESGVDRSYAQNTNPFIVFSPRFDNLISGRFASDISTMKTVALVGGPGEGNERIYETVSSGPTVGWNRREVFVNATSVRDKDENNNAIPESTVRANLREEGSTKLGLSENQHLIEFDGETAEHTMYTYGVDYRIGDVVQIQDSNGFNIPTRLIEFIQSHDRSEVKFYPTFKQDSKK